MKIKSIKVIFFYEIRLFAKNYHSIITIKNCCKNALFVDAQKSRFSL